MPVTTCAATGATASKAAIRNVAFATPSALAFHFMGGAPSWVWRRSLSVAAQICTDKPIARVRYACGTAFSVGGFSAISEANETHCVALTRRWRRGNAARSHTVGESTLDASNAFLVRRTNARCDRASLSTRHIKGGFASPPPDTSFDVRHLQR